MMAALLLACLGAFGCASNSDTENISVRPWNSPKGWEHGLPPAMLEGR
jgi:hypothetical protein